MVSAVFAVYNEEPNLVPFYEQVRGAPQETDVAYEMLFVDDVSEDR